MVSHGDWAATIKIEAERSIRCAVVRHRLAASPRLALASFSNKQSIGRPACCSALLSHRHSRQFDCGPAFIMLPPSYPPWLHGRYSLHRYYEDSDSCPALFFWHRDRDPWFAHLCFRTFRLHPRDAPLPRLLRRSASGLASDSPCGLSAVLRTSFIASSLVSRIQPYRVRIVGPHWTYQSTDYPFTSSCSPPHLTVTQLLSVTGV